MVYALFLYDYPTEAVFSFTQASYDVNESAGSAAVFVMLGQADLTFAIDVTVQTIDTGSGSATGKDEIEL